MIQVDFRYPHPVVSNPLKPSALAAAGVGHLNQLQDVDGAVRLEPLLINYYGKAIPSMALLAARKKSQPLKQRMCGSMLVSQSRLAN
jgi:hypothetical protein